MRRARRPRESIEDIAVPSFDITTEVLAAVGTAAADIFSQAAPAEPPHRRRPMRAAPQAPEVAERHLGLPRTLLYPLISGETPWGAARNSPCGEGSEDTAVPPVDPAEARLHPERVVVVPGELPLGEVALTEEEMIERMRELARQRRT
jgi:hypothetical protein